MKRVTRPIHRYKKAALRVLAAVAIALVLLTAPASKLNVSATVPTRSAPALRLPAQASGQAAAVEYGGERLGFDAAPAHRGYVLARCEAERPALLVLEKDGRLQETHLPGDGEWHAFALPWGNGEYYARLNLQNSGALYDRLYETTFTAAISEPLARYLIPTPLARYSEDSAVVATARSLYAQSASDLQFIELAFSWAQSAAEYDSSLLKAGGKYVPNLERVIAEGRAVCADYAALFAALLRSCGVPCQLLYGQLETQAGPRYHAWNQVWITDEAAGGRWWRYDATLGYGHQNPDAPQEATLLRGRPVYNAPQEIR